MCKWLVTWCLCGHGEPQPTFQVCQRKSQGRFCHLAFYYDQNNFLHPTSPLCRLCRLGDLDGVDGFGGLGCLQTQDFGLFNSLSQFSLPPSMQYPMTQGVGETNNGKANAMWTPTSLLFDQDILGDLNSDMKSSCLPNDCPPVMNYSGNTSGYQNTTAASPMPWSNNTEPRHQNLTVCPSQLASSAPTNLWMSSTNTTGILPQQLYQDYSTQPCVRTPATTHASPVFPFLVDNGEMSPADFTQFTQGTAWNFESMKKPGGH